MRSFIVAAILFAPAIGRSQQSPLFRSNTRLVQINVIARDKDGPVANLDKGDFVITDRGKPQTIGVFSIHKASATAETVSALPENTFSNRPRTISEIK